MKKTIWVLVLALLLSACAPAMAEENTDKLHEALEEMGEIAGELGKAAGDVVNEFGKVAGEAASEFGQAAGDVISHWGQQIRAFSEDPDAYVDQNEFLRNVRDAANEAGQSLKEYWPTFRHAITGSVDALLDSDMSWNDKQDALGHYVRLAIPYLREAGFDDAREQMTHALELGIECIEPILHDASDWENRQQLLARIGAEMEGELAKFEGTGDEDVKAAAAHLQSLVEATDQASASAALDACKQALATLQTT